MDRSRLATLAGFYTDRAPITRGLAVLGEDAAHHAKVRRLQIGDPVYVADGAGRHGIGTIAHLSRKEIAISLDDPVEIPPLPAVHMLVPVADRDRMLWCAEKCTELGATTWCAVMWQRSRSVSPRGEGDGFRSRIRARMQSALVQAHAPWLPTVADAEPTPESALATISKSGTRLALDAAGEPIGHVALTPPVTIAVGPEGGFDADERSMLRAARFRTVSLGANVLRFETAAIVALGIVRSALGAPTEMING